METSNQLRGKEGAVASQVLGNPDEFLDLFEGENALDADLLKFGIVSTVYALTECARQDL